MMFEDFQDEDEAVNLKRAAERARAVESVTLKRAFFRAENNEPSDQDTDLTILARKLLLLRSQVAELLPWARLGAHTAADDHEDIARFVILGSRRIPLRAAKAQDLLIRIEGGEFGGLS